MAAVTVVILAVVIAEVRLVFEFFQAGETEI